MERMTRPKDKYECRIAGGCPIEGWMMECIEGELVRNPCDECPIMPIVNKLAEYEDMEEEKIKEQHVPIIKSYSNLYKLVYGGKK
jgi:hypothetical protein